MLLLSYQSSWLADFLSIRDVLQRLLRIEVLRVGYISSEELHRHLTFRDALQEDEDARLAYEQLKYEIASLSDQDRKAYAELKETMAREFFESILQKSKS